MPRTLAYALVWLAVLSTVMGACSTAESTQTPSQGPSPTSVERPETERPKPTEATGPPSDVVSRLIQKALRSDGSVSYRTLVQRLGTPRRVEREPIANQYVRGQMDTLRTLVYTGIKALVYDVTNEEKTFLVRLSVSSSQYTTPEGLSVGLREGDVIETLGPPTRRNASPGTLIYQETKPKPTSMVVQVRDGRVVQIDWEFYFT